MSEHDGSELQSNAEVETCESFFLMGQHILLKTVTKIETLSQAHSTLIRDNINRDLVACGSI